MSIWYYAPTNITNIRHFHDNVSYYQFFVFPSAEESSIFASPNTLYGIYLLQCDSYFFKIPQFPIHILDIFDYWKDCKCKNGTAKPLSSFRYYVLRTHLIKNNI